MENSRHHCCQMMGGFRSPVVEVQEVAVANGLSVSPESSCRKAACGKDAATGRRPSSAVSRGCENGRPDVARETVVAVAADRTEEFAGANHAVALASN